MIIILATKVVCFFLIKGQEIKLVDWLWWGKGRGALRAEKGLGLGWRESRLNDS